MHRCGACCAHPSAGSASGSSRRQRAAACRTGPIRRPSKRSSRNSAMPTRRDFPTSRFRWSSCWGAANMRWSWREKRPPAISDFRCRTTRTPPRPTGVFRTCSRSAWSKPLWPARPRRTQMTSYRRWPCTAPRRKTTPQKSSARCASPPRPSCSPPASASGSMPSLRGLQTREPGCVFRTR